MPEEEKKFYPMLATRSWWLLRKKFKQSIPAKVDSLYCKKVLGGSEKSATGNVIPYLKDIGLIDEEGNTQQAFATRWRNDSEYEKICEEIKKKIYSTDLLDKIQDPASERKDTVEWFMSKTRVGEGAAKRMTTFYVLLCKADVEDEKSVGEPSEKPKEKKLKKPKDEKEEDKAVKDKTEDEESKKDKPKDDGIPIIQLPEIHLNVQIHLTSDASTDQIDQIFASMAKHLKEFFPKNKKPFFF